MLHLTSCFNLDICADKEASELGHKERGRYIQCFVYVRASPDDNFYAHPLDVVIVVELQTKKVIQWWHHKANPIIPTLNSNFHTKLVDQERGWRTGLKPLNVVQPEGPSFSVDGNMISWQKWSMRVSFNYREGLVLHTVGSVCSSSLAPFTPHPPFPSLCWLQSIRRSLVLHRVYFVHCCSRPTGNPD